MGLIRRRMWGMALTAVLAVLFVAFVVVRAVILDDSATSVDADAALENFRDSTTSSPVLTTADHSSPPPTESLPAPPPPRPAPGVYEYATVGTESVDALGGATHEFPAATFLTITERGCGVHLRWDLLEERRDEWDLCADVSGVWLQPDTVDWHAFFGQGELVVTDCLDAALISPLPPPGATPMTPTAMTCTRRGGAWNHQWQVVGTESQDVAGQTVLTVHARLSITSTTETSVIDWWVTESGLPVVMTSSKESSSETVVGTIKYHETYSAQLVSLDPLR